MKIVAAIAAAPRTGGRATTKLSVLCASLALATFWPRVSPALTSVCVSVEVRSWRKLEASTAATSRNQKPKGARNDALFERSNLLGQTLGQAAPAPPPHEGPAPAETGTLPAAAPAPPQLVPPQLTPALDPTAVPNNLPAIPSAEAERLERTRQADEARVRYVSDTDPSRKDPVEIDPARYLKRLLEYEVTHERDFMATSKKCSETLVVELYALDEGFTVFARYSGHAREEKVNRVQLDEFSELAERLARALLRDTPITETMTRENVLRADSEMRLKTVSGSSHLQFGLGTAVRVGMLPTAQGADQPVVTERRVLTPLALHVGYRRKLKSWGMDAFTRVLIGTSTKGARSNALGGHVDYSASVLGGLHFLSYLDSAAVNSLYFGGGASFELAIFQAIRPDDERTTSSRESLYGGGLNFDVLVGYEFMRTSSVHFFAQTELTAPTYLIDTERGGARLNTYLPGALAQIGVIF